MIDATRLTLFYDGTCATCVEEMRFYRTLRGGTALAFVDVAAGDDAFAAPGLAKTAALRRFHVMLPGGRISSGGPALAHVWAALPDLAPLGRFFLRKPWPCVLDAAYTVLLPAWPLLRRLLGAWARRRV